MTEQEKKVLAGCLAEGSRVLDFESALQIVDVQPAEAERLIRERAKRAKRQEERSRILRELHEAAREFAY
jgi:replicative DNA helicase